MSRKRRQPQQQWSTAARLVASCLLVLHLAAIFAAPWSEPPPSSELSRRVAAFFRPYLKFASLDNGYRFFAPNPGPSHLVRYEVVMSSGETQRGEFPLRGKHWPRLHYHRHLMLSEMTFSLTAPVMDLPPPELLSAQAREEIEIQQQLVALLHRSLADFLLRRYAGERVRLYSVQHGLPTEAEVIQGRKLDDLQLYQQFYIGEFTTKDSR